MMCRMTAHQSRSGVNASVRSPAEDRAGAVRDDNSRRDPPNYEREWKRHPAEIELLQTIVLRLDRLIELFERDRG